MKFKAVDGGSPVKKQSITKLNSFNLDSPMAELSESKESSESSEDLDSVKKKDGENSSLANSAFVTNNLMNFPLCKLNEKNISEAYTGIRLHIEKD